MQLTNFDVMMLGRDCPLVMGILNATPDSFSDGGLFNAPQHAVARARSMIAEGADIIDIGAESTRPYGDAQPVSEEGELQRLHEVLPHIVALGVAVSIDTMKSRVANWALRQGAAIVNDVWGLQRDPNMARVVGESGASVIVMHNREVVDPSVEIVEDMLRFFDRSLTIASSAGITSSRIVLDPGIGFGKTPQQSIVAIARLDALHSLGCPVLVGASRKRFIASVTPSNPQQRLGGSLAAHLLAAQRGAKIVRVHDVAETVQALRVATEIDNSVEELS
ncbi:dihydropteroate synthase [Bradyrhizobium sp. CCBAU 21362]|uniref:dihydropteroate synthase n=1 Tax=Bradyrhizobium sp. CCBAU 21362 TaxID=1325082 RepID=UPI002306C44B|nr:dihydropteroate synthase [Bradyrhizobium sp. CCBAU 21362]MDA9535290.1 dihydropteroate synthase [Bradyrhizobium sp. CCBAU 21362]